MVTRRPKKIKATRAAVDLAVLAVQGTPSVMDLPMTDFNPSPGALDLTEMEQPCSRCGRPAVEQCPECGSPLCSDCVGSPDQD